MLETRESLVFSDGPHTVVVGLSHVAVVATRDAVLVAPRDVSNALKTVVTHLKSNNDTQSLAIEHAAEIHRWGSVNTLGKGTNFEIRHLTLKPGKATPVLCHPLYDVQWTVIKGSASAVMGMEQVEINTKTTINIAAATPHSLANDTAADVECIELRTPPAGHT